VERMEGWTGVIVHGDCIEEMPKLLDISVDLCLTDPPYGTTACKWDSVIPFEPMWKELHRIVKPNGAICLFGSEPFSSALRMSNIKYFKYDWVWDKVQPAGLFLAKKQPLRLHEFVSVFYRKQSLYNRQMTDKPKSFVRKNAIRNKKNQKNKVSYEYTGFADNKYADDYDVTKTSPMSIIRFSKRPTLRIDKFHPTQKPVALLEYLIKTYTLENETVLDFTMGSGSTGVACKNLNRKFIGIEKDDKYFDIAKNRIKDDSNK
jgi:DNA modification methylase